MPKRNIKARFDLKSNLYIIVIILLCVILCIYDTRFIFPSILLCILLFCYTIWMSDKKQIEIFNHIQELASDVDTATKNNLINSPIPLILIETDSTVIWKSRSFVETFQNMDIITYLNPIIKEIKLVIDNDEQNNSYHRNIIKQVTINDKIYKLFIGITKTKKKDKRKQKEYRLSIYFVDDTRYNELFDKYNNSQMCIGIAIIDNYEDIMQRILPEERANILSNVEKVIIDWAKESGGLIFKTDRDRFIYLFEKKYLSAIEKDKINVLDKVKNVNENPDFRLTLSMAISEDGNDNYEKYKYACSAMEIVLGRGGDQAIIRKNGKYKFYGGNTIEVEKRTKVKARTIAGSIANAINESSNVIMMGHKNIDIDAIGSALGMYRLAKTLGKEAYIVSNPQGKSIDKFMEELLKNEDYRNVIISEENIDNIINEKTLLVIVDTHKINYVEFPEILDKINNKIIIDHHRKTTEAIENAILSFHEVYASSAAELVTEILQYATDEIKLSLIEAESLYGGIMVDTKDFTFKTGVRTFEAAAYLRKYGVDIIRVKKWFQADLESYNMIANIVKDVEIYNENIAISVYGNEDDKNANLICAQAADELLTIRNITASFVLGKVENKVFISGRSIGDINVQVILEKMGGGGHITLAGAQLENFTLDEAKDELLVRINEYLIEIE